MSHDPDFDPNEGLGLVALCFSMLILLLTVAAFVAVWRCI